MIITTGITLTNPNENNDRFIKVKVYPQNQEVKAMWINPIILDHREQKPNIKAGSEVFILIDDLYNYYVLGTTQQGIQLVDKKIYKIENSDEIQILTDKDLNIKAINSDFIQNTNIKTSKIAIQNDTAELISVLSDTLQALIDLEIIGNLGRPAYDSPASKQTFIQLKQKLDSFKS